MHGEDSVKVNDIFLRLFGGFYRDGMQHRTGTAVLRQLLDSDGRRYLDPVAVMQLIAVGIAAEEAEEGDVIRAADHAETAGHEAVGGHILADIGLGKKADGLAVILHRVAGGVDVPETVVLRLDVDDEYCFPRLEKLL